MLSAPCHVSSQDTLQNRAVWLRACKLCSPCTGPSRLQSVALGNKNLTPAVRSKLVAHIKMSPMHVVLCLHVQHFLLLMTRMCSFYARGSLQKQICMQMTECRRGKSKISKPVSDAMPNCGGSAVAFEKGRSANAHKHCPAGANLPAHNKGTTLSVGPKATIVDCLLVLHRRHLNGQGMTACRSITACYVAAALR